MTSNYLIKQIEESLLAIRAVDPRKPSIALVLGSGLGSYADDLEEKTEIPYEEIPHFPTSSISGHSGVLVIGTKHDKTVVAMKGRVHLYEGCSAENVVFPLRVLCQLGASTLIITNAAGGINPEFSPGDLVLIKDQINLTGHNPLVAPSESMLGARFPDMSCAYSLKLRNLAKEAALKLGFPLLSGVYAGLLGPSYETPAEIKMLTTIGADLVGMSTVCEVIAARQLSVECLGLSCVTNMASGISDTPLDHSEVKETAARVRGLFIRLVSQVIADI
jgi:purine-nucleoside phosphorylase